MSGDDLIRRDTIEAVIRNAAETRADDWSIVTRREVLALPADPVATAALRLAEAVAKRCELRVMEAYDNESVPPCYRQYWSCDWCSAPYRAPRSAFRHDDDCPLAAYRAAVAERSGT